MSAYARRQRKRNSIEKINRELMDLLGQHGELSDKDAACREMLLNIGQLRLEDLDLGDLKILNTATRELRYSMGVYKHYRNFPKAAVFGSARTPKKDPSYQLAKQLGRELTQRGWMTITGGASGIMEAAMVGAGKKHSFGLNILLPFEQSANPVIQGSRKLMYFKYFFTRKLMFLKESEATILLPGGFGTMDEGFESFTLVQTGKAKPRPLILLDPKGSTYWEGCMHFLKRHMEKEGLISKGDLALLSHYHDPKKAADEIVRFYSNYHSSRFFKGRYLIRMRRPASPKALRNMKSKYKDIIESGSFENFDHVEEDDNKDPKLHRIIFDFDRSSYSRLRCLIDTINSL